MLTHPNVFSSFLATLLCVLLAPRTYYTPSTTEPRTTAQGTLRPRYGMREESDQFTCRNCGEVEIEVVSPSIVLRGSLLSLNRTVTCMVLKANDRRTSCPCHDEFRGPRPDYVRQRVALATTTTEIIERPPTPWREIFSSVPFYAVSYAIFSAFWSGAHFLSVQPIFLGTMLHFTIKENGILTSLPFVFQVVLTSTGSCIAKWLNSNNYLGVDKVRKWFNFLYCLGYSICLLGVIYSGCERMLSTVLSIAAMSFIGLSFNGCMITPVDMSPTFAGTLMGLSNTISSVAAFMFPVIVGIMTNEEQTLEQWNKIFVMCIGLTMSSGIIFCIFGSANVQPWNYSNEESTDKTRSNNKEIEEIEQPVDAVIHL
ncbi:vesicular glutamate transporter 2.2 [Trichonephila clavipes]|nr:vesicular glutamate transporter 2.2 [Trichonephila clavipes]